MTKKLTLSIFIGFATLSLSMAQQPFYDVTVGNGNGIRFWQNDGFKISMGSSSEYQLSPTVTSYSIRSTMDNVAGRGWTWGLAGSTTNVAAMNISGDMRIAGSFKSNNLSIGATNNDYTGHPQFGSIEFPRGEIMFSNTNIQNQLYLMSNVYMEGMGSVWRYRNSSAAAGIGMDSGGIAFLTAPAGAAGSPVPLAGRLVIVNSGEVGIGTSSPGARLEVAAGTALGTSAGDALLLSRFSSTGNTNYFMNNQWVHRYTNGANWLTAALRDGISIDASYLTPTTSRTWWDRKPFENIQKWGTEGETYMTLIGGYAPNGVVTTLAVQGIVYSKEVKVDLNVPAPDYVFEKDYALPSLESVKTYIDQNKHLPEVPSAKEMEANGINLSEMNMLLLKKVEELTLYVIELKKENEKMIRTNEDQSQRLNKLENKK